MKNVTFAALLLGSLAVFAAPALPPERGVSNGPPKIEVNDKGEIIREGKAIADADAKTWLKREHERLWQANQKKDARPTIEVRIDKSVPFNRVIEVMELVMGCGFDQIGLHTLKSRKPNRRNDGF